MTIDVFSVNIRRAFINNIGRRRQRGRTGTISRLHGIIVPRRDIHTVITITGIGGIIMACTVVE